MGRKIMSIYEYFNQYSEQEIDYMISCLSEQDKMILKARFGDDLHHPTTSEDWGKELRDKYYGSLVPKMKNFLSNEQNILNLKESALLLEPKIVVSEEPKIEVVDYTLELMQLLKDGKSNREMCNLLKITPQQLSDELLKLKNNGIRHLKKYYSDGSIKYESVSRLGDLKYYNSNAQDRTIITDVVENKMKVLVISDLHIGNELERLDLINRAYDYCIKNGINIILCGGDIIDGTYSKGTQKITDVYKQIEYFIKNYPYDKSILTFSVGGDHDLSAFHAASIDIIEACNNLRHDFVIGGYNNMAILLKNDKIHMYHHVEKGEMRPTDAPIILHGHSHKFLCETINNVLNITIPSLSDINESIPSALELELEFNKGYITKSFVKQVHFGSKDIILGEISYELHKGKTFYNDQVKNVEKYRTDAKSIFDEKTLKKIKYNKKFHK